MNAIERVFLPSIPPTQKHFTVFKMFNQLHPGMGFELIDDHDPKPLFYQMIAESGNIFFWNYLESGPDCWRVHVVKSVAQENNEQENRLLRNEKLFQRSLNGGYRGL